MSEEVVANIRGRIAKCHRLADGVMDRQARKALLEMAAEMERDILRLQAKDDGKEN